jgi:hypothetical protein
MKTTYASLCLALAAPAVFAAQAVSVPPNLILPNYDRVPVGQREGIEAGAYLARTNDAAANWYNPAGLGKSLKTSLNASATAYEGTSLSLEGLGTSAGRSRISSIGTLLGLVIGNDVLHSDKVRLGFSITSPIVWQPSGLDLAASLQGGQELLGYSTNVNLDVMIPNLAVSFTPGGVESGRLRLGAGVGVAITSILQSQDISDRVTTPTDATVALRSFSADGETWGIRLSGGVQWDLTRRVTLGAMVVAPTARLLGSSLFKSHSSRWSADSLSDFIFADENVTMDYKLPLELAGGGSFQFAKGAEIEIDVRYHAAIDPYVLYASALAGRLTVQDSGGAPVVTTPPFDTTINSARAVTNVAVGANYPLSAKFRVHAGFSTDGSPVGDQTQSLFRQVNLSRFTAGVSLAGSRLSGSLGFGYSFGSGTRTSLGSTEGGQQTVTRLSVKTANLLFALSYGVGP